MVALVSLLLLVASAYVGAGTVLALAGRRRYERCSRELPRVSIVVAARDEEANLPQCLASLASLDYPQERMEIILVDHASRDRSGELLADFCARHRHAHLVRVRDGTTALCGKAAAVAAGIERSSGAIVLMTDADCLVPPTWVRAMVSHFDRDTGMVCSFTTVTARARGARGLFVRAQALDWLFLLAAASGAGLVGMPLTWVGNNLAFRRQAYDEVGGYRGVGFSLTEDFALFKAICGSTAWKVRFVRDRRALVLTQPARSWRELLHQRLRWAVGGRSVAPPGKVLLALGGGARLLLPLAMILAVHHPAAAALPLAVICTDLVLLGSTCAALGQRRILGAIIAFEALFASYVGAGAALLPFLRVLTWKGISYPLRAPSSPHRVAPQGALADGSLAAVEQESWS
ncbi:MAG: glycosyltransferase [bacterium]|jgi:glycosyltransferase involved in cell wall biosynthesis|nr:glycosyltransferase [candidate division KSB1 bacterium]MDH7559976.1 glycosyltransferase [bacterium]